MWLGVWHRVTSVHRCLWPLSTGVCLWPLSTGVCFWPLTTGVCLRAAVHRCLFSAPYVPQCIWPLFTGVRFWPLFTGVCLWPLSTVCLSLATVHRCPSSMSEAFSVRLQTEECCRHTEDGTRTLRSGTKTAVSVPR